MSDPDAPDEIEDINPDTEAETAPPIDTDEPVPSSIRFIRKGLDDNLLAIIAEPNEDLFSGIDVEVIEAWIRSQGCAGWHLHEEAIQLLSREVRRLEAKKEYVVAERKDSRIEIQVSSDRLMAWIRLHPACGGAQPTESLIRQTLADHEVSVGIKEDLIRQILEDGQCERELIAEGLAPTPGHPVKFEPLVHESDHKGVPQEREYGRVDYKDLGLFLSVKEGTPLLKHIPPTEGTPGTGVDGTPIPAPPAVDRPPHPGVGTTFSKEDPDVIVATRSGQPYFFDNSVRVDPTLEIDSVGPSTGNVSFEGNIMIRGPVESGYEVKASQDLTILDTVEGARLSAGRNLVLLTGVYGKGKAVITAGGNIEARFLNDCQVDCKGNVEIADLASHCNIQGEGMIYLGKSGGRGQAYGGRLVAMRGIMAQILGSVSETATQVELAPPQAMLSRLGKTEEEVDATRKALQITEKSLQTARESLPDGESPRIRTLEQKAASLQEKLKTLEKEHATLEEKVDAPRKGRIMAAEAHRGVTLRIGKGVEILSDLVQELSYREPVPKPPADKKDKKDSAADPPGSPRI